MSYRVIVPKAAGEPFVQTATSASEALTKLAAARLLFGAGEVLVARDDGSPVDDDELQRERTTQSAGQS